MLQHELDESLFGDDDDDVLIDDEIVLKVEQ